METEEQKLVVVFEQSLLRLPIKDVMRFGCVSKPWYSRISSCEFSRKYLNFQANNNSNNKLNLMLQGTTHGFFHSISHDYTNCRISTPIPTPQTPTQLNNQPLLANFIESYRFDIVGSCDGLLLVAVTTPFVDVIHAIYIWNPITRVHKMLPKCVPTPKSTPSKVFGFGRVPTEDSNYKVVFLETIPSIQGPLAFKVHLYTTHTNSWKTLPDTIPFHSTSCEGSLNMVLAYDNLHYVSEVDNPLERNDTIISFDLKDDKFRVPLHPCSDQFTSLNTLSALNSGLGALTKASKSESYCLWMMENFGKEDEHWTKMYCFTNPFLINNPRLFFMEVLAISQDGQILLTAHSTCPINSRVVCYNTNTNRAEILYQDISLSWTRPVVYVESLISPNSTDDRVGGQQGRFKRRRRACLQRSTQEAFILETIHL